MNVTLPNGQVIQGVPEGTTKEQIAEKAIQAGLATRADFGMEEQELSFLDQAKDVFTGESRETEQSRAAPEFDENKIQLLAAGLDPNLSLNDILSNPERMEQFNRANPSQLMQGNIKNFLQGALGKIVSPFTTDDEETSAIQQNRFGNLQQATDEQGNVYLVNPESGYSVIVNKPGVSGRDLTTAAANIAAFTPAGRAATVAGAIGKNAATQAAIEAGQAGSGGEFDTSEVALAGGLGGAFKGAENAIGAGLRVAKGKPSEEALQKIADIEGQGMTARTSDVLPAETLPGKLAESVGDSNPLGTAKQLAAKQEQRQQLADNLADKYKPDFEEIKAGIKGKQAKIQKAALEARNRGIEKASGADLIKQNSLKAIDDEIERLTTLKSGAAKADVDQGAVDTLANYRVDIENSETIEDLVDLRTNFRDKMQPAFGEKSNQREGAIKRIYGAMTKDMDDTIRPELTPAEFRQYKRGNVIYGKEIDKLKNSRVKNILKTGEELGNEQVTSALFGDSGKRDQLFRSLDARGRMNARAAIIDKIIKESFAGENISPNQLASNLSKPKNQAVINSFFKGAERKEIEGLRRALNATRQAQDATVNAPTGQRLASLLVGGGLATDLGLTLGGALASGAFARAYQSRAFRDSLLKLANTPKGSLKQEEILADIALILNATAQAEK